jgi:secreted trypsin-like serine protease
MHNGFLAEENGVPLDTPAEAYYGLRMASLAARPGDVSVAAQSSSLLLAAHAVKRSDGVGIVPINKHPNQMFEVSVSISGAELAQTGIRYDFGRTNFKFNSTWAADGPATTKAEYLGNTFTVTVPVFSEAVILLSPKMTTRGRWA